MLPFVEVPCKTLSELPRNVGETILALAAVNKKWSRLPADVRDLVAQNMRRATPSAMAFKEAFNVLDRHGLYERWICARSIMKREQFPVASEWARVYHWSICRESGYVSLEWRSRRVGRAQLLRKGVPT